MTSSPRSNRKVFRFVAAAFIVALALANAVSPALAGNDLESLERGAVTVVGIFAIIGFAVVFEIWRLGLHKPQDVRKIAGHRR